MTLVFTQVDRYQTEDDFLHSFTPAELDLIGHDHPDVDWMMVSVLVPPDSEFGIDAFVRRVTGLGEFGVPALARLAAQQKAAATSALPPAPMRDRSRLSRPEPEAQERVPPASNPDAQERVPPTRGRGFLTLVLFVAVLFGIAYLAVAFLPRILEALRKPPAPTRERSRLSRPDDVAATNAVPPAITNVVSADAATNAAPVVSVQAALSNETAAAFAAARACATPQEAREALAYAAEALGSADALYELARVDDLLGWGAFVRTREEKDRKPLWTAWLRRIDLLGEKKAVFMQQAFTNDLVYRAEALKGYRAAAARGVPAAVEALARHATHENDKDVRRSSAAKPEAK